ADGADLELAAVGDDVEVGGSGAEGFLGGGVDVGAEAPAFLEGAGRGGHDGGVEAGAGDEGEGAAVDAAEVDVDGVAAERDVDGGLEGEGDVEVLRDLVGGAAGDDGERDAGADEAGGGLGDGAVASDDADGAVAEAGGVAGQLGGVARMGGLCEIERCEARREGAADAAAQAGGFGVARGGVEDDEGAVRFRAGRTRGRLRWWGHPRGPAGPVRR